MERANGSIYTALLSPSRTLALREDPQLERMAAYSESLQVACKVTKSSSQQTDASRRFTSFP